MKITGIIRDIAIVLAGVCIALFWIFGWNGLLDIADCCLIATGVCVLIALIAMIINRILERRNYII